MNKIDLVPMGESIVQKKLEVYHVEVRQHGEVVGTFNWRKDNRRDNIHSVSKSVLSVGIGMAIHEGIMRLDEHPADIFADKLPENPPQNLLDMTIRDMIMMATGHDYFILQGYTGNPKLPGREEIPNDDWVEYALSFDVPYKPGTYWKYNNFGPYLASVIIQERTGQKLTEWLQPRLFDPLGIKNPQWFESVRHYTLGCGGLHLSTPELSRFAQLLVNKGEWEGKQLVPAAWIEEATAKQIDNAIPGKVQPIDSCAGYGYFFWRCARDNAYAGHGWAGQYIIIFPDQDACVTIMSHDFNGQAIFDSVWETIVPQLKANA